MTLTAALIDALGELIAPTRCAGCERQGVLLCRNCLATVARDFDAAKACPVCAGPYGTLVCTECWDADFAFTQAAALGVLDGPLARAVVLFKDANERRLADVLGSLLGERVHERWGGWADAITWIPASHAAIRRRGFDHAQLLATAVAKALGVDPASSAGQATLRVLPLLQRPHARDQRGLSRRERLTGGTRFIAAERTRASNILLVDDVLTTGATAHSAAETLLAAGAAEVRLAVLARAW